MGKQEENSLEENKSLTHTHIHRHVPGWVNFAVGGAAGHYGSPRYPIRLVMGFIAGGMGGFIGTPAEVAFVRMIAQERLPRERRKYTTVYNTLSKIVREEGFMSVWNGATFTISRAMAVNGVHLATYTQVREWIEPTVGAGFKLHICSALFSGLGTAVISLPLDVIKTRRQEQTGANRTPHWKIFMNIVKNGGVLSLWNGFLPTFVRTAPYTIFTFFFIDELKALYFHFT